LPDNQELTLLFILSIHSKMVRPSSKRPKKDSDADGYIQVLSKIGNKMESEKETAQKATKKKLPKISVHRKRKLKLKSRPLRKKRKLSLTRSQTLLELRIFWGTRMRFKPTNHRDCISLRHGRATPWIKRHSNPWRASRNITSMLVSKSIHSFHPCIIRSPYSFENQYLFTVSQQVPSDHRKA
jgi:hypothetical protein